MDANSHSKDQSERGPLYAGIIWIVSALALLTYGAMGLLHAKVPGAEQLVDFLSTLDGTYIYLAAFISIFIEGLYVVGGFFPGTSLVVILALLSQLNGFVTFVATIVTIFFGWCLAGAVNIYLATAFRTQLAPPQHVNAYEVEDRVWTTWFPAFRANYEVSQISEGGHHWHVFLSSVRVKFFASLAAGGGALIVSLFKDVQAITNDEGFITLAIVAGISLCVGVFKIRNYLLSR